MLRTFYVRFTNSFMAMVQQDQELFHYEEIKLIVCAVLETTSQYASKWLIWNRINSVIKQYLKPFNWVKTITIPVCKEITSNLSKNKITYKLLTYKSSMYDHLTVCKQMKSSNFKNFICKLFTNHKFNIC